MHNAAFSTSDNPDLITILLDAGASLEARDRFDRTPLHCAVVSENPAVITVLLDAGADPKAESDEGKLPWDYAKDRGDLKGTEAYRRLREVSR